MPWSLVHCYFWLSLIFPIRYSLRRVGRINLLHITQFADFPVQTRLLSLVISWFRCVWARKSVNSVGFWIPPGSDWGKPAPELWHWSKNNIYDSQQILLYYILYIYITNTEQTLYWCKNHAKWTKICCLFQEFNQMIYLQKHGTSCSLCWFIYLFLSMCWSLQKSMLNAECRPGRHVLKTVWL